MPVGDQPAGGTLGEASPPQSPARETATFSIEAHKIDSDTAHGLEAPAEGASGSTDVGRSVVGALKEILDNMLEAEVAGVKKSVWAARRMVSS